MFSININTRIICSILLALLLMWQISQSQSVFVQNLIGESIIANIILLMPSFILLGAGIVLLRIFPLLIRGLSILLSLKYISNFIPSWIVLSLWHIGRSSNTYSRMSLLIILAAALASGRPAPGGPLASARIAKVKARKSR